MKNDAIDSLSRINQVVARFSKNVTINRLPRLNSISHPNLSTSKKLEIEHPTSRSHNIILSDAERA